MEVLSRWCYNVEEARGERIGEGEETQEHLTTCNTETGNAERGDDTEKQYRLAYALRSEPKTQKASPHLKLTDIAQDCRERDAAYRQLTVS